MTDLVSPGAPTAPRRPFRQRAWQRAEELACRLFHSLLRLKARDMTKATARRSALVLAPHADDETLGCGGLIALKRQAGTPVTVLMATDGAASHRLEQTLETRGDTLVALRAQETRTACARLGLEAEALQFLNGPDGALDTHEDRLSAAILGGLEQMQPEEVYVCALSDGHPDHQALARAARRAILTWADRSEGPMPQLYEYPVWSFDFRSWRKPGTNTTGFLRGVADMLRTARRWRMVVVRLSAAGRNQKAYALAAHASQLGSYAPEPHWSALPNEFLRHFRARHEVFHVIDTEAIDTETLRRDTDQATGGVTV